MSSGRSEDEEKALRNFLSKMVDVPSINLDAFEVAADVIRLVPKVAAFKHLVVPVSHVGSMLVLAMADPRDLVAAEAIRSITGCTIEVVRSEEAAIRRALARYF